MEDAETKIAIIPIELDKIDNQLTRLTAGIKKLEERMKLILKPDIRSRDGKCEEVMPKSGCSILNDKLDTFSSILSGLISHIDDLTSRIEI